MMQTWRSAARITQLVGYRAIQRPALLGMLLLCIALLSAGCDGDEDSEPAPTQQPAAATAIPTADAEPASTQQPAAAASESDTSSSDENSVSVLISDAAVARYVVGEQLARLPSPIDAVGETSEVTGAIVFAPDGKVIAEQSKLTVALAGLESDEDRRDRWVRNQLFSTEQFPNAELTITEVTGLAWPLPQSGESAFTMLGDLTIREVTKPVEWDVTASFDSESVTGMAVTTVTFQQFELSKPTFAFIISVEDDIRVEIDISATLERG